MKYKRAKTVKPYTINFKGYDIAVPVGSIVSNRTACGPDDNYRFWQDWHNIAKDLTGFNNSILSHDLEYYGLNIPAEFCEPYQN